MNLVSPTAEQVRVPRGVERLVHGVATSDGAGVKLTRVLTQPLQRRLDPYLMLDAFASDDPRDYGAGFPDHPHRGFETITYMVAGRMRHRDSAGHEGLLGPGGVQWMCAGRGLVHSEMPEQADGVMEGFQLWLNLPSSEKLSEPWYRDLQAQDIPSFTLPEGVQVRVIAGCSHGVDGAVQRAHTEPLYLDLHLLAGARHAQPVPATHNTFVYVYRGELKIGHTRVPAQRMAILANAEGADGVILECDEDTRVLLIAGRPLGEPIAQYGPFVMNSHEQIFQAVEDFRAGRFGAPR
ncbi:pirin family protein [Caldimonas brevitalea]|uniref:Pirin n=1 Tax=Caldimonas brevitalea TaxID=413882 RepID=A0A0G3BJL7_9BURK|nr:pirin family protein [Caldimonas brevitalea]AKJ28178.1 pirin [Caldimonas brevitalea]